MLQTSLQNVIIYLFLAAGCLQIFFLRCRISLLLYGSGAKPECKMNTSTVCGSLLCILFYWTYIKSSAQTVSMELLDLNIILAPEQTF